MPRPPSINALPSLDQCPALPRSMPRPPSINAPPSLDQCPALPQSMPRPSLSLSSPCISCLAQSPCRYDAINGLPAAQHSVVFERVSQWGGGGGGGGWKRKMGTCQLFPQPEYEATLSISGWLSIGKWELTVATVQTVSLWTRHPNVIKHLRATAHLPSPVDNQRAILSKPTLSMSPPAGGQTISGAILSLSFSIRNRLVCCSTWRLYIHRLRPNRYSMQTAILFKAANKKIKVAVLALVTNSQRLFTHFEIPTLLLPFGTRTGPQYRRRDGHSCKIIGESHRWVPCLLSYSYIIHFELIVHNCSLVTFMRLLSSVGMSSDMSTLVLLKYTSHLTVNSVYPLYLCRLLGVHEGKVLEFSHQRHVRRHADTAQWSHEGD